MWSDNESLSDYIDYSHLIKAVTGILNNEELLPCSIGIFGDWGGGKSSLMSMIEQGYKGQPDILVIKFNGWLFEGYEDAKTVLMGRIVDEIIDKRILSEKAIKFAAKLLKRIDWIKVAGSTAKYGISYLTLGPAGVALAASHDALKTSKESEQTHKESDYEKFIKKRKEPGNEHDSDETLRSNLQEFHKNFEDLINETKLKKIVVFIDDLDRCSPDTIIGTLEAIKLFLFTKKTAFIIGADERLIKYAVRRRFPEVPGDNMEVGRDYLEKLIQYPIRIPSLSTAELTTYINLLFSKLYCAKEDFETIRGQVIDKKRSDGYNFIFDQANYKDFFSTTDAEFDEAIAMCSQIVPVLSIGLNGNPRQVKRFLNTLLIRLNMAEAKGGKLKRRLLAKLMLLEYFKPETFSSFHDYQATNGGTIPLIQSIEKTLGNTEIEGNDNVSSEQKLLLDDPWMVDWIKSEPLLQQENLQPYFYFSRDKLTVTTTNLQRMTPKAQEVVQKLLSESQANQLIGVRAIKQLSNSEAASIFEAFTSKVRQEENITGDSRAFKSLFDLVREKKELKSQLLTFLNKFPENNLPMSAATLTESLFKDTDPGALTELFNKWSNSTNSRLKSVVKKKMK